MSNNQDLTGLPPPTLMKGSGNPSLAAQQNMNASNQKLNSLGKIGGKKRKYLRGGAAAVEAPPANNMYPDGGATQNNVNNLTSASMNAKTNAAFDGTVGSGPSATANIVQQQEAIRKGGGHKSRKRGGGVIWGCLSGGKHKNTRRHKKSKKYTKNKKSKKSKKYFIKSR